MKYSSADIIFAICGALILCYLYYNRRRWRKAFLLPPGPRPLPIIGNLLEMPEERAWETYNRWKKEYGDITHVQSFGRHFFIINSFKVAYELFEKRSSIYSDRPHITMLHELMGFGAGTPSQRYGPSWRQHRTMYHKQFNQVAVQQFQPKQLATVQSLLRALLQTPTKFRQLFYHMATSIVLDIAYGHEVAPKADPLVSLVERVNVAFGRGIRPGAFLVNFFPILKYVPEWFPGAEFQKIARESRNVVCSSREIPFEEVRRRLAVGAARPSFVANALTELRAEKRSPEEFNLIKGVAGSIYGAGAETTVSSLSFFILAMIIYPEVQKRAQEELDYVIGKDRLPQFSDRPHLPYIEAVVKETLRWIPVAPTAIPHASTQDDVYNGYFIPKGSIIIGNTWGMLHDPEMYADPLTFRPERFLPDHDGNVERDPGNTGAFGFGRRICAGRNLADASLWITIPSILAVFDLSKAVDEHTTEIDVHYATRPLPGSFSHPPTFPCLIMPRSGQAEALIKGIGVECA